MAEESWLALIRNARLSSEQIHALRAIKNEIVGHNRKKEKVVRVGALELIVRLSPNKTSSKQDGKAHDHTSVSESLSEDEMVRLQALQVIASIANGGPSFLAPLYYANALPAILSNLCPNNNPPQLVRASLQALSNLTDSAALAISRPPLSLTSLAEALFTRQHLGPLYRIISQTSESVETQSQISLVASLISRLCRDERHQQNLVGAGVLDALAVKLASFVVAEGLVIPTAEILARREGLYEHIPPPAPPNADLSVILGAVAVIISDSKYRASQLLYNPSILAIFPSIAADSLPPYNGRAAWNSFNGATSGARQGQLNPIDYMLPSIPSKVIQSSAFPPLGSSGSREHLPLDRGRSSQGTNWGESLNTDEKDELSEPESPLIAYLILLLRSQNGMLRLMAAFVLTILYRAGLTKQSREADLGPLVVPLLIQMLEEQPGVRAKSSSKPAEVIATEWAIKEKAPAILAMLITDSQPLQKAAFDAKVIAKLSKLIKVAYDPVADDSYMKHWSPEDGGLAEHLESTPSSSLGEKGQSALLVHKIKVRESTLKAIAALVPFQEDYRKSVVDHGIVPYIVESLNDHPKKPSPKVNDPSDKSERKKGVIEPEVQSEGYGINPVEVLVAACGATRALSRSVSILRTTLIDNGIAKPVFPLLKHNDIEVQIAATAAVCNLVTDMAPMKEQFQAAGVLKILCDNAHSTNAKLRLNATWALKHYVISENVEMKRTCLEELGQGWLVQLICDDTEDEALSSKAKNASTNVTDEMDEDIEMDQFDDQIPPTAPGSFTSRPSSSRSKSLQQAEAKLLALREAELNPTRKARKDDVAVQEQGLDFIRNLIGPGGTNDDGSAGCSDMIDYLLSSLGQDRFFGILESKLRPKVINPFNRRGSGSPDTKLLPPTPEIIIAVIYILVHIAASEPRHRALVCAQTDLLKLLVPQLSSSNPEVKIAMCWFVTNVTWMEDGNDKANCSKRTEELKRLGFIDKIEALIRADPELGVRERAKGALLQVSRNL